MSSFLNLVPFYKPIAKDGKKKPLMNVLGQISVNVFIAALSKSTNKYCGFESVSNYETWCGKGYKSIF